jgi:N-acetylmuramoyl-L-alanine amidase
LAILLRCLLGCAFLLSLPDAQAKSAGKLQSVKLYGEQYVSLEKWASSKGLSFAWNQRTKSADLKTSWVHLSFQVDSKRISINGITVWLSHAIASRGGSPYVSKRDIDKLLLPVLYPEDLPRGKKIRTIAIAAGHGGKDPGYQINKTQEKKYTLLMAHALKDGLKAAGFKVVMTRESDVFIDLGAQAEKANRARADLFITVHYNAASEVTAKGVETYCLTPAGATSTNGGSRSRRSRGNSEDPFNALLAYKVHKSLIRSTGFEDRGLRRAGFQVLREISMPGVYIEGGFLSNPSDAARITSAAHRKTAARAVVAGVMSFKRLVEAK